MIFSRRMGVLLILVVGLLLLGAAPIQQTDAIRLADFFPFGPDFEEALETGNNPSVTVDLAQSIPYFGQSRNQIIVENDGVLELRSASSSAFVYAFSADVDTTGIGHVFYRETTDPGLLQEASSSVNDVFPNLAPVSLTSLFIATWFYVGYFDNHIDRTNTFQCILSTDGSQSFVALLYADDMIQWMTGDADGGVNGLGGDRADVGFVSENSMNSFFLPASNTSAVLMLDSMSNVGMGGLWIFRMDQDAIIQPSDNVEPPGSGSIGGSGSGSGSGSGGGNGLFGASCVQAGFATCCVGTEAECTVGPSPIECSCSRDCYFSQTTTCCHDITEVPCFPEITVSLSSSIIMTPESESAQVSIAMFGFPADPFAFRSPVEAFILLYTSDGTALAPSDYEGAVRVLEFSQNGVQTVSVDVNDDSELEDTEYFFVNISTTDDYVNILVDSAQVFIGDNDGSFMVALGQPVYVAQESDDEVSVCVTALSSTAMLTSNVAVIVRTESGTATETVPLDYSAILAPVIFTPSSPSQICVAIPITSDDIFETQEVFSVVLENLDGTTPTDPSRASVVIIDDDTVAVGFNASSYTAIEGEPAIVCMQVVVGAIESTITFSLSTTGVTASSSDFNDGSFILQILAGNDVGCVEIPTVEDTDEEGNELFIVSAQPIGQDSSRVLVAITSATVTIEDNDVVVPDVTISLQFATYSAFESDLMEEVCVFVDGTSLPSGRVVQYRIQTVDQTALGGFDYESIDMLVNITVLPALMCFPIFLLEDSTIENRERLEVVISSDDPAVSIDRMQSIVFIEDSTTITLQFMPVLYTVSESEGVVEVCVTAAESVQLERPISYSIQTIDDSAMGGLDYTNTSDFVIIASAPFLNCTMILIEDDSVAENTEQFFVLLGSNDPAVDIGTDFATVTILDISGVLVSFVQATYLADEDQGTVEVCLSLAGQLDRNLNVTISAISDSATATDDYLPFTGFPVMFVSAPSQECIDIVIVDDNDIEQDEFFEVEIDSQQADGAVSIGSLNRTIVGIVDNDVVICGVALTSVTYMGFEGERFATVCLQLFGETPVDITAQLVTIDGLGTATADMDYESLSATVTFPPSGGFAVQCQNVTLLDDDLEEEEETFQVQISDSDCQIAQPEATVTIVDDDEFNLLSFSQALYTAAESEGQVEVCVDSLVPVARDAVATIITVSQSAIDGEDYVGGFLTVTLLRGTSQSCITISIIDDSMLEDQIETFQLFLSNVDPGVDTSASLATVQIFDDDVPDEILIQFEQQTYIVSETGTSQEVCAVPSATPEPGQSVSATLSTVDDSATGGVDYTPLANIVLTFTSTSLQRQCVTIGIINDVEVEPTEQFFVQIDQTTSQGPVSFQAGVLIVNDDEVIVSFELATYGASEGQGSVEVCAVPSATPLPGQSVSVLVSTEDGTAIAGSDYAALMNEILTFTFISPQRQCVMIEILDDQLVEPAEDFTVRIDQSTSQGLVSDQALVNILDNDAVGDILVTFELDTYSTMEGEPTVEGCVVTSATPAPGQTVIVFFSTEDGTATAGSDYVAVINQEIVFTSESPQRLCGTIEILDDQLVEQLEQFTVRINQSTSQGIVSDQASVIILDDDVEENILITFELNSYGASEGELSVEVCAVTSATPASGQNVSAQISTEDGTATANSDYNSLVNEVLTFMSTSLQRQCVDIGIIDDALVEPIEQFVVRLSQLEIQQEDEAVVSITDNDVPVEDCLVSLFGAATISEDATFVSICVQLDGPTTNNVFINYNTVPLTATADSDYQSVSTVLTFPPTPILSVDCPQIPIIDDAIAEPDESFEVQISTASCQVAQSSFTVVIQDNDQGGAPVLRLSQTTYDVSEADLSVDICVQSSAPLLESASATVTTSDISATDGLDYVGGSVIVTIAVGQSEACATFNIIDDGLFEGSESFGVALSSSDLIVDPQFSTAVVNINDNDAIPIVFEESTYSVGEQDGALEICAVAPASLDVSVAVTIQATGGTAQAGSDYSGLPSTLSFTPETSRTQCLIIQILDDALSEQTETILLLLSDNSGGAMVTPTQTTVFIIDDDVGGELTVTLEQAAYLFSENADPASIMVCVDLMETSLNRVVDIQLTLRQGSALSDVDFVQETALITFDPMNSEPIICEILQLINDIFFEETEEFFVDLSSSDPAVTFIIQTASISIINDDALVAVAQFIDVGDFFFVEGDAPNQQPLLNDICVEVVPPGYPGIAQVIVSTNDETATRGLDYSGVSQLLTFPPGINELCTSFISILGDDQIEPTEGFRISLAAINSDINVGGEVIASILDDDQANEPIVLINDTPDVEVNEVENTASVRVDFTLRSDVVSAQCSLGTNFPPTDCTSRTILFEGIPADTREPLPFIVRTFNQLGEEVGNVTRNVRIGFNLDCSVLFINMGADDLFLSEQGSVLIDWELVGPVEFTECRLETRVESGNDIIGEYSNCDSPHLIHSLPPGNYGVKVRPNGANCLRRIRRTIDFTIQ